MVECNDDDWDDNGEDGDWGDWEDNEPDLMDFDQPGLDRQDS